MPPRVGVIFTRRHVDRSSCSVRTAVSALYERCGGDRMESVRLPRQGMWQVFTGEYG